MRWVSALPLLYLMHVPSLAYAADGGYLFDQGGAGMLFLKSMTGLALVLALFALLVWLAKRMKFPLLPGVSHGPVRLVQRLAVSSRHSIVVLECERQRWLVGLSPQNMELLGKLESSENKDRGLRES